MSPFILRRSNRTPKNSSCKLGIQELESRALMSATYNPADQILRVTGSDAAETIRVVNEAGTIRVEGKTITMANGSTVQSLPVANVWFVRADGLGGNDRIEMVQRGVAANGGVMLEANGGTGSDTIVGGSAADRLNGGTEDDLLVGGAGVDVLDGGGQSDRLFQAHGIDARPLADGNFWLDNAQYDSATPFEANLSAGSHEVRADWDAYAPFTVNADGTMAYNSAYEGVLTGAGTSLLNVNGAAVTIDPTALGSTYFILNGQPTGTTAPTRTGLLPGQHFISTYGSDVIWFGVNANGTFAYGPELEGVLQGAGSASLKVNGAAVTINASALTRTDFSLDQTNRDASSPFTMRLLPGDHLINTPNSDTIWFKVLTNGTISYDAVYEGILTGRGTSQLNVNGAAVTIDARTLWGDEINFDYTMTSTVAPIAARLLPGDHFVSWRTATNWFKVQMNGTVSYAAEFEGSFTGQGTNTLRVNGRSVSIDPSKSTPRVQYLDGLTTPTTSFTTNLLHGRHFLTTTDGINHWFTVDARGVSQADSPIAAVFIRMGGVVGTDRVLRIRGTEGADTINLIQNGSNISLMGMTIGVTQADGSFVDQATVPISLIDQAVIEAFGGDDFVRYSTVNASGRVLITSLLGGDGFDTLAGGSGSDIIYGGKDNDQLSGDGGVDSMWGEAGDDKMGGDLGNDNLYGGIGNDTLLGGSEPDSLIGGEGNDSLEGGTGNDTLWGAEAFNTQTYFDGVNTLRGNENNDVIYGSNNVDYIYGDAGSDRMQGEGGNDHMDGGSGLNTLFGGDGSDILRGGEEADRLIGGHDNSWESDEGGLANDTLYGNGGPDTLYGGVGEDSLSGGSGNDSMFGGAHNDRMFGGRDKDRMRGEAGHDLMYGESGDDNMDGGLDNDTLVGGEGGDTLSGSTGNDTIFGAIEFYDYAIQDGANVLYGDNGNDNLYGGNGRDTIEGGADNDGLFGGEGTNTLRGNGGADRFLVRPGKLIGDLNPEDARLTMSSGMYAGLDWTDREIYLTDLGLAFLHAQTNNTRLLKLHPDHELSPGGELTFQRVGSLGENTMADNDDKGLIRIADYSFDAGVPHHETIIHEIGHNWEDELSSQLQTDWLNLSGWQPHVNGNGSVFAPDGYIVSRDGQWDYLATAQFHRAYGRTNPLEDWSTMWEAYYRWKTGTLSEANVARLQAKLNFVDAVFASQRT